MKKLTKISILLLSLILTVSCEDNDKDKFNYGNPAEAGPMLLLEVTSPVLDVTDFANSSFKANLTAPTNNVQSYDLYVQRLGATGTQGQVAFLKNISSFPAELTVTASDIATALNTTLDSFLAGDEFKFTAEVTRTDGKVFDFNTLDPDLQNEPGQRQAYRFNTYISCPFVVEDLVGTYELIQTAFMGGAGSTYEVIAGPGENQYSIVDLANNNTALLEDGTKADLVVTVNPASGVSVPSDQYPHYSDFAFPAEEDAGFTFSCIGSISLLKFKYTCCGTYPLQLTKIQ